MKAISTFAGNILARGRTGSGNTRWYPGRPHTWTDTEVVAVVTRDGTWHAYLIDDSEREEFAAWVRGCGEWADADGECDAEIRFDQTADWQA